MQYGGPCCFLEDHCFSFQRLRMNDHGRYNQILRHKKRKGDMCFWFFDLTLNLHKRPDEGSVNFSLVDTLRYITGL